MSIGRLVVDLVLNTGQFETDTGRAAKQADKLAKEIDKSIAKVGKVVATAAAAAAAGIALMVKSAIDGADSLNDLSKASGVSVESLSALGYAAGQSGTSMDSLATGMKKLSSAAYDAAKGSKSASDTFKTLGVNVKNADGSLRSTEDILLDVAEVFSQYEDGAAKAAIAQDLFGKSGTELIPFLNEGKEGIVALKEEAAKLGLVISTQTAQAADDFNDNLTKLKSSISGVGNTLAAELLPSLVEITGELVEFIKQGDGVSRIASAIDTAFRLIVDIGSRVVETFVDIGTAFGAIAAAAVQAAQGNFRAAYDIIKQANEDGKARDKEYTDFRVKLWEDAGKKIVDEAKKTDKGLKGTKVFGAGTGGEESFDVDQFISAIREGDTQGRIEHQERFLQSINDTDAAIRQMTADTEAANDASLNQLSEGFLKLNDDVEMTADLFDEFGKEAARNIQDSFADFLFDPFQDGLDGMLKGFADVMRRMVAEAIAADLMKRALGAASGAGGWVGALAGVFGGGRAIGGPVSAGTMYRVNEAGPEYFKPNVGGKVVPLSQMQSSPSVNVTQQFNVSGSPPSMQTQQQLAAAAGRGIAQATRRNN